MSIPFEKTHQLIQDFENLLHWNSDQFNAWHAVLNRIEERLNEPLMRVAVIGSVKSGKSSLVNALLGKDLLRRGAGVLTAAITRIRYAPENKAKITLKTWDEINNQVEQSATILTQTIGKQLNSPIDLRSESTRLELNELVQSIDQDPLEMDPFSEERLLLQSFLQGFEEMSPFVDEQKSTVFWTGEETLQHRKWVSQDQCAVYLDDVLLEDANLKWKQIELTDCQGNDSVNPIHFSMVQQYLAHCSQIIYVISSRTGIRQADLELLKTLRELRMLDRTLFIVNLDLSELETSDESIRVLKQIASDLKRWSNTPQIISVSALAALFTALKSKRSSIESSRLRLWKKSSPLYSEHETQWNQLNQTILDKTNQDSLNELKLDAEKNHWLHLISQFEKLLEETQNVNQQKSNQNLAQRHDAQQKKKTMEQAAVSFEASLDSALSHWKNQVVLEVTQIFESLDGQSVNSRLENYIKNYSPHHQLDHNSIQNEKSGKKAFFSQIFSWHKELQTQLLQYVSTEINASLLREILQLEQAIIQDLQKLCIPFMSIAVYKTDLNADQKTLMMEDFPEMNLSPISFTFNSRGLDRLKGISMLGKGLFQGMGKVAWSSLSGGNQNSSNSFYAKIQEQALNSLKEEALENLDFDVHNYQQNLAYLHLYKGMEQMVQNMRQNMDGIIGSTLTDYESLDRKLLDESLKNTEYPEKMEHILREIKKLKNTVNPESSPNGSTP